MLNAKCFSVHLSGPEAVKYIVNHAAVRAIFCEPKTLNIVSTNHDSVKGLMQNLVLFVWSIAICFYQIRYLMSDHCT